MASEPILLLNSAPIPRTDLSCSLVDVGHELSFPIDFLASKHFELISSPESVESFAKTQAKLLGASREIVKILLEGHRTYHRECINLRRRDPCIYEEGGIVFYPSLSPL